MNLDAAEVQTKLLVACNVANGRAVYRSAVANYLAIGNRMPVIWAYIISANFALTESLAFHLHVKPHVYLLQYWQWLTQAKHMTLLARSLITITAYPNKPKKHGLLRSACRITEGLISYNAFMMLLDESRTRCDQIAGYP
ncbi:hypothetical protein RF11_13155 [Thelohanellus kitauei]|uniref:Uncharacterized protein n=1 Tax=Thelohanellus kitauei TaxID=669202 RepID=A0A0C2JNS9_THEKT|nr:hypothetical protein RF11_13155 [Thelohanellus kitauei]